MAEAHQGVSKAMISDIWRAHNIQPHRPQSLELSRNAQFLEKLTYVGCELVVTCDIRERGV